MVAGAQSVNGETRTRRAANADEARTLPDMGFPDSMENARIAQVARLP